MKNRIPYRIRRAGSCWAITVPSGYMSTIRAARTTDQALLTAHIALAKDGTPLLVYRPATQAMRDALATDYHATKETPDAS